MDAISRYFLEVSYKGTNYAGFQIQTNAVTIQSTVENALHTFYRVPIHLTGSSRTDAGVHAYQNFFHFDSFCVIEKAHLHNLNAILPSDIVIKAITKVSANAHSRFDAIERTYTYHIYFEKDVFLDGVAWFYPYPVSFQLLQQASELIAARTDFSAFAKKNTQVNNFNCLVKESFWQQSAHSYTYTIKANRFLRGMVRAIVATMVKVGRHKMPLEMLAHAIEPHDGTIDFSAPSKGLFLQRVQYPEPLQSLLHCDDFSIDQVRFK